MDLRCVQPGRCSACRLPAARRFTRRRRRASQSFRLEGTVLISVNNRDKEEVIEPAKMLAEDGFSIVATGGTCDLLKEHGIPAKKVKKLYEGRPNIADIVRQTVRYSSMINTPVGKNHSAYDDSYLRKARDQGEGAIHDDGCRGKGVGRGDYRYEKRNGHGEVKSLPEDACRDL